MTSPAPIDAFPCVLCNCVYDKASDLMSHLKIHDQQTLPEALQLQRGLAHSDGQPEMPCNKCDKIFMGKEALAFTRGRCMQTTRRRRRA